MIDWNKQCELAALQAQVEGMRAENMGRMIQGESLAYTENHFDEIANQMRALKDRGPKLSDQDLELIKSNGLGSINNTPSPEPTYCGLTAKQWERVRDEKFLVQVSDGTQLWDNRAPAFLVEIVNESPEQMFKVGADNCFDFFPYCRPYRAVGHRQPHFGGEYPGNPEDKIVLKERWDAQLARQLFWSDITEYIVLEEAKDANN